MYLYRAIDSVGDTVEFYFSENRDLPAAKRFFSKALDRHGRPDRVVIDGSQTNHEAIVSCDTTNRLQERSRHRLKPITIRKSRYLNNRIEQDYRRIKRRVRSMLGFKSFAAAAVPGHRDLNNGRTHRSHVPNSEFATEPRRLICSCQVASPVTVTKREPGSNPSLVIAKRPDASAADSGW